MWLRPLLRKAKSDMLVAGRLLAVAFTACGVFTAAAYLFVGYLVPSVSDHRYFELRSVKIASDAELTDPERLATAAGLFEGTSLWRIDTEQARRELEKPGWVRRADVIRRFPDRVTLRIFKRVAVAATIVEGSVYLVDEEGVVFREEGPSERPDLPYLVGWQDAATHGERVARLRRLVDVLAEAGGHGLEISELEVDAEGGVLFYPEAPRIVVRVGAQSDLVESFDRLEVVLTSVARGVDNVAEIDLTYPDRAVVRTRAGRMDRVISARAEVTLGRVPRAVAAGGRPAGRLESDRG